MKKIFSANLLLLTLLLSIPFSAYGQAEIGIFEMKTPNAMIIFDTSSSMNMNVDGVSVPNSYIEVDGKRLHFNGGGDHPDSKLYQAKYALKEVIKELQNVNLGFATYGQLKQEGRRGYYRKWVVSGSRKWCEKRYWRWTTDHEGPYEAYSSSPDSFTDRWGQHHSGVRVETRFYGETIEIWDKNSRIPPHSNLRKKSYDLWYTVTKITYSAEYNRYTYRYESDPYDDYRETMMTIEGCGDCQTDAENRPFPRKRWEWSTYFSGESEYENPYGGREPRTYWQCQTRTQGGSEQWEYQWRTIAGTVCPRTDGEWEYVGNCYDNSNYYYPIGSNSPSLSPSSNRPHTWSYFKVENNIEQGYIWPDAIQQVPYYPASRAEPGLQDNHFFFINFPETDDRNSNYETRNKIVSWLDLTPVENPETKRNHTKLPLKINAITSNTIESVYTPLADSLSLAKKYFDDYINKYKGGDAATKAQCRGNYVILLTDGLESCRFSNSLPDYGAAPTVSAELLKLGVKTFVIGFGKDIKGNDTLNKIAESGGTEKAYFAGNAAELKDAFKLVFQAIAGNYSRSNPVVTRERDKIYRSYLSLPGWQGHLEAYKVNEEGGLVKKLWDAGEIMNSRGRGNVYTWPQDNLEPKREKFQKQSAKRIKEHLNPSSKEEDIDEDGKKDEKDAETIIEFILDPKHNNGKHKGDRSLLWKLGDIYHSSPVIVGKPAFNFPDDLFPRKYSDFKRANENRATFIYVGANDGMLHVFDDEGTEKFAAIPKNVLGNLKDLRLGHRFYIDSSPTAYDVYLRKGKNDWRTIVMSGERSGGTYYFAIDVTAPDDPDQLWELTDANMGMTWSRPVIGRVKIAGVEKFVAFVGGGYSLADGLGNAFYVIDIDEGVILKKFIVGNGANKVPAGATTFDRDLDGRVDGVYFGDIQGTLWKIKIDGNENAEDWKLIELFKSDGGRPIFYPPAVTKNNQGKVLVYFGQGDELNLFDTQTYNFYEIWDKGDGGEKMWAFALPGKGEKVLAAPAISNNVIYFTTWENTESVDNCGAGKGRLYGLTSTRQGTEGGLPALYFDIGGTRLDKPIPSLEIGIGIPSAPVVTNGTIYVSSSFHADEILGIKIPPWGKGKLKSWREVF